MQCVNPIYLRAMDMFVPCGRCIGCTVDRTDEWATRIVHEQVSHENSMFVTFTYDDKYLPAGQSLDKDELVRTFKRIRRRLDLSHRKIRYFACGEYGEKFKRPHYHAIIFGLKPCNSCLCCNKDARRASIIPKSGTDCEVVYASWNPRGYLSIGQVYYSTARYVASYIVAKWKKDSIEGRARPFQLQSQGLGRDFCDAQAKALRENLGCTIEGKKKGIPRYYKKRLGITKNEILIRLADQDLIRDSGEQYWRYMDNRKANMTGKEIWQENKKMFEQRRKNLEAFQSQRNERKKL